MATTSVGRRRRRSLTKASPRRGSLSAPNSGRRTGVFADDYLDPQAGGLHVVGFLEWGGLEASVGGNVGGSDPTGALFTVGGGYAFWMADEWSIGPLLRLTYAPLSLNDTDYSTTQVSLVANLKWH